MHRTTTHQPDPWPIDREHGAPSIAPPIPSAIGQAYAAQAARFLAMAALATSRKDR